MAGNTLELVHWRKGDSCDEKFATSSPIFRILSKLNLFLRVMNDNHLDNKLFWQKKIVFDSPNLFYKSVVNYCNDAARMEDGTRNKLKHPKECSITKTCPPLVTGLLKPHDRDFNQSFLVPANWRCYCFW